MSTLDLCPLLLPVEQQTQSPVSALTIPLSSAYLGKAVLAFCPSSTPHKHPEAEMEELGGTQGGYSGKAALGPAAEQALRDEKQPGGFPLQTGNHC